MQHIVIVTEGRSVGIVQGWRAALALIRTARRTRGRERWTVRGATFPDLHRLPRF